MKPQLSPTRFKRMALETKHYVPFEIKSIRRKDGMVIVEGFANRATVDRTDELIPPGAWDISEYVENPVVLFNHGKDPNYGFLPVGKSLATKVTDDGLWARVVMSQSDVPKLKAIRDLVEEGILMSFSVGFDPGNERRDANGVNIIGKAKLLEISIVTLPMNKESTFQLTSKDIDVMTTNLKTLRQKGAWVASAVQQRIYQLQQSHGDFNRDRALEEIGDQSGLRLDEVKAILAGEVTPIPADVLEAFAKVLGMDEGELANLDKGDLQVSKRQATAGGARQFGATQKGASLPPLRPDGPADWAEVMERAPKTDENIPPQKKAQPGPDAVAEDTEHYEQPVDKDIADGDADPDVEQPEAGTKDDQPLGTGEPEDEPGDTPPEDADDDEEPDVAVQAIVIPKEVVPNIQDATAWVKDHGWTVDDVNQSEEAFYFVQADPSAFDADSFYLIDIGNGAWAQVGARDSEEPSGTPPIDAQNEAKGDETGHNQGIKPKTQQSAPDAVAAPAPAKKEADETGEGKEQEPEAKKDDSGGQDATVPFAQPQGAGPWTGSKPPPKKKPTVNIDPHTGSKRKGADPNADNETGQPVDAEALDEHKEKVKAGTACAECMAKWMKDGHDNGKPHDQAVAIAISECKQVCPTQPTKDGSPVYSGEQLRAFADGYRTAHEQAKGVGLFKAGTKGGAVPDRVKLGHMDESPTSTIGAGGSQDPTAAMEENPYLLVGRQTNVLLGALIAEVQALSKKLDGFSQEEAAEPEHQEGQPATPQDLGVQPGMQPGGPEKSLALENVRDYMQQLHLRLKKLGV